MSNGNDQFAHSKGLRRQNDKLKCGTNNHKGSEQQQESYLFAFDFDHTVVNDNSDTFIQTLVKSPLPDEIENFCDGSNWTEYMNKVFQFLHEQGVTIPDICRCIHKMEPTPGMLQLLTSLVSLQQQTGARQQPSTTAAPPEDLTPNRPPPPKIHLLIISDANDLFISEYLKARLLDPSNQLNGSSTATTASSTSASFQLNNQQTLFPFDIITNKSSVGSLLHSQGSSNNNSGNRGTSTSSALSISPFEFQTECKICPKNLCKGSAILKYMETKGPFTRVFYTGDGKNDVCPALKLNQRDVVFVRKNYTMYKKVLKSTNSLGITAKLVFWEDAQVIQSTINEHI